MQHILAVTNDDCYTLGIYNLIHRYLEEELRECKRDLEAKEREIESLMRR